MRSEKIRRLTLGGMMAAIIAVFTAYVSCPIPGGYFHPGDAMIALCAVVLGPYAAIPAAIGSMLADLLVGYQQYAVFTFLIKGLIGLLAGWGCARGTLNLRSVTTLIIAALALPAGYAAADICIGDMALVIADLPWNCLQAAVFLISGLVCLGTKLRKLIDRF